MGRDLFTRVCVGGRISIYIGLCCTAVMFVIGALAGALAGLKGGLVDDIIMRICEMIGNLPYLIIVTILSMVMGRICPLTIRAVPTHAVRLMANTRENKLLPITIERIVTIIRYGRFRFILVCAVQRSCL